MLSSLVYEARRGGDGEPRHYPGGISGSIAIASSKLKGICEDIDILCEDHGLDEMQRPTSAFSTSCMNGRMAVRWDRACTAPT